ncbi:GDP-L-fucose synthase [compost metagenome]
MQHDSKVYVAGHRGLVGSALVRELRREGYHNLVTRTHGELDLTDQHAVAAFFERERPEYVFLAAAKVGGIQANNVYPADFIDQNLAIQSHVIHAAAKTGVRRLLFLGSSCIYPKECPQPIREDYFLTGPLEPTNRPYALAKIAGVESCWAYNRQYGTQYLAVMPTNLFGPGDNYDLANSHVLPALIRKFHEALQGGAPSVVVWGSGAPRREFLYSDDMANACVFLMGLDDTRFVPLLAADRNDGVPPIINVGTGSDLSILELAEMVASVIGYSGGIELDRSKPDGTMRKLLSVDRLHQLGWRHRTELKEGIEAAYRDYLDNVAGIGHGQPHQEKR